MPLLFRGRGRAFPLLLLLAGCAPDGGGTPVGTSPGPGETAYACQMRGAAAEDRYAGPLGNLSIDSALVRADVTAACLDARTRR